MPCHVASLAIFWRLGRRPVDRSTVFSDEGQQPAETGRDNQTEGADHGRRDSVNLERKEGTVNMHNQNWFLGLVKPHQVKSLRPLFWKRSLYT